jgi:hypothetical protein
MTVTRKDRRRWLAALKMLDDWDGAHDGRGENAIPTWLTRRELTVLEQAEFLRMREEILIARGQRRQIGRPSNSDQRSPFQVTTTQREARGSLTCS